MRACGMGARRTPDLAIENVHAVFNGDWIPQVRSITLSHSVLRVAFDGEKLSFGTLQRLVDSFTAPVPSGPVVVLPSPAQTPLRIVLQDAKVLGFTPAGVVSLAGDGVVAGGKVERFLRHHRPRQSARAGFCAAAFRRRFLGAKRSGRG